MGIKNLNKFLKSKCPSAFSEIALSDFQFKKCSVDVSLFVFKYKTVFGQDWLSAVTNLIGCLKRNQIHPCFIYDTAAPVEKSDERKDRKEKRDKLELRVFNLESSLQKAKMTGEIDDELRELNKTIGCKSLLRKEISINFSVLEAEIERLKKQIVTINPQDFDNSKHVLSCLGIPFYQAPLEAETICADLCKEGIVDFVLSEDTDVLAYGAPYLLTKINTATDTGILINYQEILKSLGLTREEFLDFCIMCGTDYNDNIFKIGPEKAYKLIKEFHTIDNLTLDISCLNHIRVREIFTKYEKLNNDIPYCSEANFKKLARFFIENNIRYNIDKIEKDFKPLEIEFE